MTACTHLFTGVAIALGEQLGGDRDTDRLRADCSRSDHEPFYRCHARTYYVHFITRFNTPAPLSLFSYSSPFPSLTIFSGSYHEPFC